MRKVLGHFLGFFTVHHVIRQGGNILCLCGINRTECFERKDMHVFSFLLGFFNNNLIFGDQFVDVLVLDIDVLALAIRNDEVGGNAKNRTENKCDNRNADQESDHMSRRFIPQARHHIDCIAKRKSLQFFQKVERNRFRMPDLFTEEISRRIKESELGYRIRHKRRNDARNLRKFE